MADKETKISCPACEYERNSHGRPVKRDGQMQCLDCGASWRVFGTHMSSLPEKIATTPNKTQIKELSEKMAFQVHEPDDTASSNHAGIQTNITNYKPGFGTLMACFSAGLLFVGLYLGTLFLENGAETMPSDALYIAEVEIEEQVRKNGDKVFTVKGLVANPTNLSKPIPPIAIILRKQNGSEVTRWYYNSSLAALRAGGKSRFASSIQYDTPIVAYAEAVFK